MDESSRAVRGRGVSLTPHPRFPPLTSDAWESRHSLNYGFAAGRCLARVVDAGTEKITLPAAVFPTPGVSPVARRWWRQLSGVASTRAGLLAPEASATLSSQAPAVLIPRFRALKLGRPEPSGGLSKQGAIGVWRVRHPLTVPVGQDPWPPMALRASHVQEAR